jgi:DNA excision repair protein ERCC-4
MVIPVGQDGKSETPPNNITLLNKSTRKGGSGLLIPQRKTVLIDTREFRSKLPSLLHAQGLDIIPIMLDVGDYVLSKDICVQ